MCSYVYGYGFMALLLLRRFQQILEALKPLIRKKFWK